MITNLLVLAKICEKDFSAWRKSLFADAGIFEVVHGRP